MFLWDFSPVPSSCPPLGGKSNAFVGVNSGARVDVQVCGSVQSPVLCLCPKCVRCDELLTIEPISFSCSDLVEVRESYPGAQSQCALFQEVSTERISDFLKEINIFGKMWT